MNILARKHASLYFIHSRVKDRCLPVYYSRLLHSKLAFQFTLVSCYYECSALHDQCDRTSHTSLTTHLSMYMLRGVRAPGAGGAGGAKGKFGWSGLCDRGLQEKKRKTFLSLPCFRPCIQLFWERSSEKVPAIIRKVLWVAFEFTVLQRNLKEWHERPWTYVCECYMIATEVGSTATLSWNSVLIISNNPSRNSCTNIQRNAGNKQRHFKLLILK